MESKNKIAIIIVCFIALMLIIIVAKYVANGNSLNELNNMYKDIRTLEDAVSIYFLDNGNLPIKGENIEFNKSINPNDGEEYYEIDLSLMNNMNLFFGSRRNGKDDIYIINKVSHTIYYYSGVEYNKKIYYTKEDIEYEKIDIENYK